ncbi:MAG TPA: hypothetical protein PL042_04745 [Caldisericia bacterium]|jgi:hypothetical protein|nr:hypothetical protein [Caldisericia bacterium]
MEPKILFRTFHVLNENAKEIGRVTVAKRFEEDGALKVAFAFCSPKDKYAKKHGQLIAKGRLLNRPKKRFVTYNTSIQELKDIVSAYAEMRDIKWWKEAKALV